MSSSARHSQRIAVIGATGAVGGEVLSILADRGYSAEQIACFGSDRSAGSSIHYQHSELRIAPLSELARYELDYAIACADASVAQQARSLLKNSSALLIDNSSAFRMEEGVPLIVPEVNGRQLTQRTNLIANPNCSTIMLVRVLDPIHRAFGLRGVTVTTYQAVSGAGRAGIDELRSQTRAAMSGATRAPELFPVDCAFNVFEHESAIDPETGFNGEETKIIKETKRILGLPSLEILPTCVRVPVERAHAQSVVVELARSADAEQLRQLLSDSGIRCAPEQHPLTPLGVSGTDDVHAGRIRMDPSSEGRRAVLWICCDQIRKGAALNAIQIMEHGFSECDRA
jgi:aspartate-semialdehyde dehydrogenase